MDVRSLLVLFFLCLNLLHAQPSAANGALDIGELDAWVARAQKQFEVPGLAIGIVKDGKTVLTKGYGVRQLGNPAPVDEHTLFGIASNTKAFTAAAVAILVDEGKLSWDDPVQEHLPQFEMADPYVAREVTVRDLLSHRTGLGLGAGDLLYWPDTNFTRAQVIAAARHLSPASSFRSRYAYNNLGFVVAGEVVAAASHESWDDFVRERILLPLGMNETKITNGGLDPSIVNMAVPHSRGWRLEGTLRPISPTRDEVWAAAAGIKTNVSDLVHWVTLQLNAGKLPDGKALFSEKQAREMWSAQIPIRISDPIPGLKSTKPNFAAYGLGWSLKDYQGRKIVTHTGGLTGMVSLTLLVPSEKLGIVILTNQEEGGAFQSIAYHILDQYLGLPPQDWIKAYAESAAKTRREANEKEAKELSARRPNTQPSLPLAEYAAAYTDAWYGDATLELDQEHLYLRFAGTPSMHGPLEHFHLNTFIVHWDDQTIPDAYLNFQFNPDGKIASFDMKAISDLADFSFDYQDLHFRRQAAQKPEQQITSQ